MLTWRDHIQELPAHWAELLAAQCRKFQEALPSEPVEAARIALEIDRLWGEVWDSDDLTPHLARLLSPRSLRGCREDLFDSHHAWWLASQGKLRSATTLLQTFELEDDWANLARSLLPGGPPPPRSRPGKRLREVVEKLHRREPVKMSGSMAKRAAFELALAGEAQLTAWPWEVVVRDYGWFGKGILDLSNVQAPLGNRSEATRLGRLAHGRGFKLSPEELPLDCDWPKLERAARRDKHHGHRDLFRRLLKALRPPRFLPEPVSWEKWLMVEGDRDQMFQVCRCAWLALRRAPWLHQLPVTDDFANLAAQADLLDYTGYRDAALEVRQRLPGDPMLAYALQIDGESREDFLRFGQEEAQVNQVRRERRHSLQRLLDQGELAAALELASGTDLLDLVALLEPTDDWDAVESRIARVTYPSYRIQVMLRLGAARRSRAVFARLRAEHPTELAALGGDPLPPFRLPLDSVFIAYSVIEAMDARTPEPELRAYLLELPTSAIMLETVIDQLVSQKSVADIQGPFRCVLQDLLARSADFPWSSSHTIANIGWLCPDRMAELEQLLD